MTLFTVKFDKLNSNGQKVGTGAYRRLADSKEKARKAVASKYRKVTKVEASA